MIDLRLQELIEIESYEMCARVRDWRKEVVAAMSYEQDEKEEATKEEIKIRITRNSTTT